MGTSDLDVRDDGSFVVEAPTAQAALEAVRARFGPEANIVDAELVQSKGIAGFFSKQLYRVRVLVPGVVAPAAGPTVSGAPDHSQSAGSAAAPLKSMSLMAAADEPVEQAVDVVLRRVEAGEETGHMSFGEALHAELAARGVRQAHEGEIASGDPRLREMVIQRDCAVSGTVDVRDEAVSQPVDDVLTDESRDPAAAQAPVPPPAALFSLGTVDPDERQEVVSGRGHLGRPLDEWAPGSGPVLWSVEQLSAVGLDPAMIAAFSALDPADDLGWVYRLSEALSPVCAPMPDEALLFVGHDVDVASSQMGITAVSYPETPGYDGDAAVSMGPEGVSAMSYIGHVRAGRQLHVVCDGTGWIDDLLRYEPVSCAVRVVSTTRPALGEAIRAAVTVGGVLGYFLEVDRLIRITPFELALGVRSLLPRA